MRDLSGKIIYIGKAKDLAKRVSHYFNPGADKNRSWKIPNLAALIRKIDYIPCESENDALILERDFIHKYQPFFNQMWKDDKSYPCLKLTVKEDFPRLLLTREKVKDGSLYFGPYPKVSQIKALLRHLTRRKFLRLRQCRWDIRKGKRLEQKKIHSCLYYHTGQCPAPCALKISKPEYSKYAKQAVMFLEGRYGELRKNFKRSMSLASAKLEYETAGLYLNLLKALDEISGRIKISRLSPLKTQELIKTTQAATRLMQALGLKTPPLHIEAFDTSHISGKNPVGAMVCFRNGERFTGHYRKFRIKSAPPSQGADDFAMIKEIVKRRLEALKNSPHAVPDLFLIDGGKGQLSSASEALEEAGFKIPVVSLAKKDEELFVLGVSRPVKLEASDPALKLLQAARDEAHRFALSYHRYLRTKSLLEEK